MFSSNLCLVTISSLALFITAVDLMTMENVHELQSRDPDYLERTKSCICYLVVDPVCATDGQTYTNCCFLGCEKNHNPALRPVCKGKCPCNATSAIEMWSSGNPAC